MRILSTVKHGERQQRQFAHMFPKVICSGLRAESKPLTMMTVTEIVCITEVVADSVQFLESKKSDESAQNEATGAYTQNDEYADYAADIQDDDLPF